MRFQLFQAPANMNLEFSNRAPEAGLERFEATGADCRPTWCLKKLLLKYLDLFYFLNKKVSCCFNFENIR
jgi:hypothetical protein